MTTQITPISPTDLSVLIGRHSPVEPDPCRICGADMTISSMGGGNATIYRCSVASDLYLTNADQATTEANHEHYRKSEQRITYHGDSALVAALHELRALRQATGKDMTVPVGAYAYPHGHGDGRCYYRLRHLGGDRWEETYDFNFSHDPTHSDKVGQR